MPSLNSDKLCLSVREAVQLYTRSGDIKNTYLGYTSASGTELHKKIQNEERSKNHGYFPEVSLSTVIKFSECEIKLCGRADGIFESNGEYTVDEIKSVLSSLNNIDTASRKFALNQAKCYAYMLCTKKSLSYVKVRVIYINSENEERKVFLYSFSREELCVFFNEVINACHDFVCLFKNHAAARNESLENLRFPFAPRDGQKTLVNDIYKSLMKEHRVYVNAPTGIGKTMAVLFPAVKALGKNKFDKIFYLTSKNSLAGVAENAVDILNKKGAKIKSVTLTAKNKICFASHACLPFMCSYAIGYHDRVRGAVNDAFSTENIITREKVESYALKYTVCPYELSLALAELCDIVICDYNYIFDPKAEVKSNFEGKACLLVDEAHNLVERVRGIYSIRISKAPFTKIKSIFKDIAPELCGNADKIIHIFKTMLKDAQEGGDFVLYQPPLELYNLSIKFYDSLRSLISKKTVRDYFGTAQNPEAVLYDISEFLHTLSHFIRIFNLFDDSYGAYMDDRGGVNLFCIDTSSVIATKLSDRGNAVLFSATLSPDEYYTRMLAMSDNDSYLCVPSPFDIDNFLVLVAKADTRLKERENSLAAILGIINKAADVKAGNYIAFFPSYSYMKLAYNAYRNTYPEHKIMIQKENLTEPERDALLASFEENPSKVTVVFAVMGSILSEGIDLTGERLSGAFIVGIGLPQICEEREMIRRYFDEKGDEGNNYAYIYPSANKVFQAGGRVIRSENDRGFLFLIDERFALEDYLEMLPHHWNNYRIVDGDLEAAELLCDFWGI